MSQNTVISADGSVVAGNFMDSQNYLDQAYKYSESGDRITLDNQSGNATYVIGMSADGAVITGLTRIASSGEQHAFKYSDKDGFVDLGTLGGKQSTANALSSDGSTIVGWSYVSTQSNIYQAFKYTDKDGMVSLGTLGGDYSNARGVSANGSVVVGEASLADNSTHAFKKVDNKVMDDLGTLGGTSSRAIAVSDDGSVVVGNSDLLTPNVSHAFKHTDEDGMVDLGTLGGRTSSAAGVSADGSTVFGNSLIQGDLYNNAFKHTDDRGMVSLGTLGGNQSYAMSTSADGSVVVGYSELANGTIHAYRHTDSGGIQDLGTLGGSTSMAVDVSADGKVTVGASETTNGEVHAVLWKNNAIVDTDNTRTALARTAQQATQVLDMRSVQLQMLMLQDCITNPENGRFCIGAGATYSGSSNARSSAASFTLGYQLTPQWRIGTTANQSFDSSLPSEYKSSNNLPGIGVFATFNARKDGLGWQARVAAAYQKSKVDINRKQLSHTEGGIGRAALEGKAVTAEGSYRMLANNGYVLAPYAALRYSSVNRGAYSESNGVEFVGRYAEMGRSATMLDAGLRVGKMVSDKLNLSLDVGMESDISVNNQGFAVAMDYVGGFALGNGEDQRTRAHMSLQGNYALAKDSAIHGGVYWAQQAYGNSSTGAQIRLIRQF